ncbi:MBL fold metallo-hydrolase [Ornithinibacillus californiensis]|uniref:MBL fold metallo-hydrolase n=1 Tax=Ornithinibacillus californiensis TaxID=161536 RepID=UPI00064D9F81|nr:MBL fold metallo-hydrolase [Ornithinibacillus californiensis]
MVKIMTTKELARKVIQHEETLILDVRNTDEFDNWKIEGGKVEVINEPYFNLLDGVDPVAEKLKKKEQEIIVVCAKGGSSEMVAELLEDDGFPNVYSLEGGMKLWSEHLEPIKVGDLSGGGTLYQFVRLGKGCLSYFIKGNGEAAIIDTSRMTDIYEEFAKEKGVKITHVLDTHLHADHISGGRQLAEKVGATYHLPPKDATEVTFEYTPLEEGKDIEVGGTVKVRPIYSPGHTIGSTSFLIDDQYLLTGDILFVRSIGRPDLAGLAEDWVSDLRQTLYNRYKELSEDLIVLPAHYSFAEELGKGGLVSARLGDLYDRNSGLQVDDENQFRKMVTENLPPQPNAYEDIRKTNMGKISPEEEKKKEMETGPNRCAVEG